MRQFPRTLNFSKVKLTATNSLYIIPILSFYMAFQEREQRMNLIFDLINRGATTPEIDAALGEQKEQQITCIGNNSERRALYLFSSVYFVQDVIGVSNYNDRNWKVDGYIQLDQNRKVTKGLPKFIPYQVKSSDIDVERYRNSPGYLALQKKVFVVNAGRRMSKTKFKKQAYKEIRRIRGLYMSQVDN